MCAILLSLLTLISISIPLAFGFVIITPSSANGWRNLGSQLVEWQLAGTDPATFAVVLTSVDSTVNQLLAAGVDSNRWFTFVNPPGGGWPVGTSFNFRVNFVSANDLNTIYASSQLFNIEPVAPVDITTSLTPVPSPTSSTVSSTTSSSSSSATSATSFSKPTSTASSSRRTSTTSSSRPTLTAPSSRPTSTAPSSRPTSTAPSSRPTSTAPSSRPTSTAPSLRPTSISSSLTTKTTFSSSTTSSTRSTTSTSSPHFTSPLYLTSHFSTAPSSTSAPVTRTVRGVHLGRAIRLSRHEFFD